MLLLYFKAFIRIITIGAIIVFLYSFTTTTALHLINFISLVKLYMIK